MAKKKKSGISIRDYAAATSAMARRESQFTLQQETLLPRQKDSALQMLMEERERSTLQKAIAGRPINTKRKYEGYQSEFAEWSQSMGFSDGVTVTGSKLHLFLDTQVVGRESKKKKGKVIGASTVYGYVNAIVDLYNQQVANKMNANEHPRTYKVKQLLSTVQAETTATRKKNYTDRGVGSLLDGYQSESQFTQICDTFFALNDLLGRAAFLVSHFGLLRGENIRDLELADMFSQELDKEGFQPCIALVLLVQHGKTNSFGKLQHVGFMRNKAVHLCPVGAVAFYLFERFHLNGEAFPSFRRSQDWYDIKFLRGQDPKKSISYNNHKKRYEAVFKHLGLTFNKKTHINRQQGVRQLENADVDVSQTRRHGRWGLDTVEAVYSAPLAREAIRALSGHPPRSRLYYLDRAIVEPPNDLKQCIFPGLESCKQKILVGEWECNLAARGFIDLLEFLRTVLLQDAAFLFDILPDRVRNHYVFGGAFQQYRAQALESAQTTQHPVEMQLQLAMPILSQQINTQHAATMQRLESQHLALVDMVKQSQAQLTSFLHGEVLCRLLPVSTNATHSGSIHPPLDSSSHVSITPNTAVHQHSQQLDSTPVPQYTMSRAVSTVRDLWTEWHHGIANQPSIEFLEGRFGTKWRASSKEAKFFSRRRHVIDHVRSLVNDGYSVEDAIDKVDFLRGGKSIDGFSKWLRSNQSS